MAVAPILQIGDPRLRQVSAPVAVEDIGSIQTQALIDTIIATMRNANGAGLAAPQIGAMVRICAVEVGDNPRYPYKPKIPLTVIVNPEIEILSDDAQRFENFEGCLSVPNLRGRVLRHPHIRVRGLDRQGKPLDFEAKGISAGTYQHEFDHLDGLLFVDRVHDPKSLCTWDNFQAHFKEGFVQEVQGIVERWGS